jgi:hypothetical protein
MSQKYKGKQSNNIHKQKLSKIQNDRKIEKSLQVAQKRGNKSSKYQIPRLLEIEHSTSTIVSFPKDASIKHCAGCRWISYS